MSPVIKFAAILALLGGATYATGEEIPEGFSGVRATGMGDAFTAVANDESAVWTNPAGIARTRKARSRSTFHITKFPNIIGGANANGQNFYKGYSTAADQSVESIIAASENLGDKPFWARAALFPVTIIDPLPATPMALGIYSNTVAKIVVPKDTPDVARIEAVSDLGGVITLGSQNFSNRLNTAIQLRPVARYAYEDKIPSASLLNKSEMATRLKDDSNKSQALAIDTGVIFTLADFWFPTIGFSVLNVPTGCRANYLNPFTQKEERVCGTVFRGTFANDDALSTVDATDIRAGLAITPRLGRGLSIRLALDMHHIPLGNAGASYGLQGIEVGKLVHVGAELFLGNPLDIPEFALRAGYSQGFASFGVTADLGLAELEFATFGRDVSSTVAPLEDRRFLGSITFWF
jgi:hypothetical protein